MSRLEEIKNEYLKSLGYRNYDHLVDDIKSGRSPIEKLILLEDDISEKYAKECSQASLDKASRIAKTLKNGNSGSYLDASIDKESITQESNIVLL